MNKRIWKALLLGTLAGIIYLVPMIIQKQPWDLSISAFIMWPIIAFFIALLDLPVIEPQKGVLVALLIQTPSAVLIGWHNPMDLIQVLIMTMVLGILIGWAMNKWDP